MLQATTQQNFGSCWSVTSNAIVWGLGLVCQDHNEVIMKQQVRSFISSPLHVIWHTPHWAALCGKSAWWTPAFIQSICRINQLGKEIHYWSCRFFLKASIEKLRTQSSDSGKQTQPISPHACGPLTNYWRPHERLDLQLSQVQHA